MEADIYSLIIQETFGLKIRHDYYGIIIAIVMCQQLTVTGCSARSSLTGHRDSM